MGFPCDENISMQKKINQRFCRKFVDFRCDFDVSGVIFCEIELFNKPSVSVTSQLTTVWPILGFFASWFVAVQLLRRNSNHLYQLQIAFFENIVSKSFDLIPIIIFVRFFAVEKNVLSAPGHVDATGMRLIVEVARIDYNRVDRFLISKPKNSMKKLQTNHSFCMQNLKIN